MSEDIILERWLPVPKTDGFYDASDFGRVRSWKNRSGWPGKVAEPVIIVPWIDSDTGYPCVGLNFDGKKKTIQVHRLVVSAFISEIPKGMQVAHNNGVRTDNRLSNLRIDTRKGNMADRVKHGTSQRGEQSSRAKLKAVDVQKIRALLAKGRTQKSVADMFGVSQSNIWFIAAGRSWSHLPTEKAV